MKIAFLVNDVAAEDPRTTTNLIANEARKRDHEVYWLGVEDFCFRPAGELTLHARRAPARRYRTFRHYLAAVQDERAKLCELPVGGLDVLMLRNDPAADAADRPWAQTVGVSFGREAARRGVVVLNDPAGLAQALDKSYFQRFPAAVRPLTLITRDPAEVREFVAARRNKVVLKPLQGSGGKSVFLVREGRAEAR